MRKCTPKKQNGFKGHLREIKGVIDKRGIME